MLRFTASVALFVTLVTSSALPQARDVGYTCYVTCEHAKGAEAAEYNITIAAPSCQLVTNVAANKGVLQDANHEFSLIMKGDERCKTCNFFRYASRT
jgi:hypothetical protein